MPNMARKHLIKLSEAFRSFQKLSEAFRSFQKSARLTNFNSLPARLFIGAIGTILLRYPSFAFFFDAAGLHRNRVTLNNLSTFRTSDTPIWAELVSGQSGYKGIFFPTWPYLVRTFQSIMPFELTSMQAVIVASWIISFFCGLLCLFVFDRFYSADKKFLGFAGKAWLILALVSIYPHGHFWIQGYSEPLFALFYLLAIAAMQSKRMLLASIFIGTTAIIRPQGVWFLPIWGIFLLVSYFRNHFKTSARLKELVRYGLYGAFMTVPFALLIIWYRNVFNDALYYFHIQASNYGRGFDFLAGLANHKPRWDSAMLFLYISLYGSYRLITQKKNQTSLFIGFSGLAITEIPLFFGGFYSYVRFLSVCFALFTGIIDLSTRFKWLLPTAIGFLVVKLAIQIYHSGFGYWVG